MNITSRCMGWRRRTTRNWWRNWSRSSKLHTRRGRLSALQSFTMKLFGSQKPAQLVTTGRFELERDGQVAYLEYTLTGDVLGLIHSEVPDALRGHGLASSL